MSNIAVNPPVNMVPKFKDIRVEIWGDSFNWSFARRLDQVVKLAFHHSVTSKNATPNDIALLHKARGWGGIGYHFVIPGDGTVYYVGDIGTGRANIANNNEKIIGICFCGDFTKEKWTEEQRIAGKGLAEYFMTKFPALPNINTWNDVIGHKEASQLWSGSEPTACPGTNWKGHTDSLYDTMRANIPTPTPVPAEDPRIKQLQEQIKQKDAAIAELTPYKGKIEQIREIVK